MSIETETSKKIFEAIDFQSLLRFFINTGNQFKYAKVFLLKTSYLKKKIQNTKSYKYYCVAIKKKEISFIQNILKTLEFLMQCHKLQKNITCIRFTKKRYARLDKYTICLRNIHAATFPLRLQEK